MCSCFDNEQFRWMFVFWQTEDPGDCGMRVCLAVDCFRCCRLWWCTSSSWRCWVAYFWYLMGTASALRFWVLPACCLRRCICFPWHQLLVLVFGWENVCLDWGSARRKRWYKIRERKEEEEAKEKMEVREVGRGNRWGELAKSNFVVRCICSGSVYWCVAIVLSCCYHIILLLSLLSIGASSELPMLSHLCFRRCVIPDFSGRMRE